jgi:YspA, cpYpsA-related SLOG family
MSVKTIVAGGRRYQLTDANYALLDNSDITEVVCGGAKGADECGKQWALTNQIPVKLFPADWNKFGKAAGLIRNTEMAKYAEKLIAFWNGVSSGTEHMIYTAEKLGLNVVVVMYSEE